MLALPVIFGLVWLPALFRRPGWRRRAISTIAAIAVAIIVLSVLAEYGPYPAYFKTLAWDWLRLARRSLADACITVSQFGFWGAGLGTATQGSRQLVDPGLRIWQEDGLARALVELGVPGVLLAVAALAIIGRSAVAAWRRSILMIPPRSGPKSWPANCSGFGTTIRTTVIRVTVPLYTA